MVNATVLIENTAPEGSGLAFEAGLSIYIEYNGKKILLDAGISGDFADNAKKLGVKLEDVELGILSHGHFDHADGLPAFFRANDGVEVLIRRGADGPHWSTAPKPHFIGIDRTLWGEWHRRFRFVEGVYPLCEGAWLLPDGEVDPIFAGQGKNLVYDRGEGDYIPDDFRHEQSLVFETPEGLVVFNPCSHSGIVNIVRGVKKVFPEKKVRAVVGGFHLFSWVDPSGMNCTEEYIARVAAELKELGVEEVYTGHCTGLPALALLQKHFGPGCHGITTGMNFQL